MLPHGAGNLVDRDDLQSFLGGFWRGIGCLVEGGDYAVIQSPHGTCCRIDDEHSADNSPRDEVGKIPATDAGIEGDGLGGSLSSKLDKIFGWLEVTK